MLAATLLALLVVNPSNADSPIRSGDRIAIIGNTFADQLRMHGYLETLLLQHTIDDPVSIRNLGWGGDMLEARDRPTGFPTEESTLTAHKTDVIIACFGMGESFAGEPGLEDFKSQLRSLIASHAGKKYNGKTEVRLILVSPIACEDRGKLTPQREKRNEDLAAYTLAMRDVASDVDVSFVDLYETSRYLMDEPSGPDLTDNGIHLNPFGYWALSRSFFDQLTASDRGADSQPWLIRVDASAETGTARGVEISDLTSDENGLRFLIDEKTAPSLPPPTDLQLPPQLRFVRDTLVVQNLAEGQYQLVVDGQAVATASAKTWDGGVAVDATPAHGAVEAYRATVNDKNLQFTYSWKALNQVHIVGERKGSPSGKALPREVIEFNQLANKRDQALRKGIEAKTRQWKLMRVGG